MAIKFKFVDLLTGTSHVGAGAATGEARGYINLGSNGDCGIVRAIEFKGDDDAVDNNAQFALTDRDGRQLMAARAVDAGGTTSDEYTQQQSAIGTAVSAVSTVGVQNALGYIETAYADDNATRDLAADTEGVIPGVFARGPILVTLTAGSDGDWHRVGVWVETGIKYRYADILTGTTYDNGVGASTGTFVKNIGLGSTYGEILGIEFKGDDADVNASTTFAFSDADGRTLLPAMVVDAGGTTRDEYTDQECIIGATVGVASTVGDFQVPGYDPGRVFDSAGDVSAATEGKNMGIFAKSPVTVTGAAGTDGDYFRVGLWVRV
jgi:hypothetical protein